MIDLRETIGVNMSDEKSALVATETVQATVSEDNNNDMLRLQNEAKANAKEAQSLRSRLRDLEKRAETEKQQVLADQGKYKELFETKEKEVNDLLLFKEKGDAIESKYQELSKITNKIITAQVPENFRKLIPDLPIEQKLQWVENAVDSGIFKKQTPSTSGHAGVSSNGKFDFNSLDQKDKRQMIHSFGGGRKL